jgi:dolichol kinase
VACLFASTLLLVVNPLFSWNLTPFALFTGSLVATLAELVDMPLDDNFRIPVLSGLAMELLIPG